MLNKVTLIGRLGADPVIENARATFSLATNEFWTDRHTGDSRQHTEWHRIVVFGNLISIVKQRMRRGTLVYVGGVIRTSRWEDDGQTRYCTQIIAQEIRCLSRSEAVATADRPEKQHDDDTPDADFPF